MHKRCPSPFSLFRFGYLSINGHINFEKDNQKTDPGDEMDNQFIVEEIKRNAIPLHNAQALDALVEAIGDSKIVLLGEASHGTAEYYDLRRELSKKLIQEKGFSFIAVEGDWPSCYAVNRYIKRGAQKDVHQLLEQAFNRWPSWMWANEETLQLAEWLKQHNAGRSQEEQVGFFGLDVYSLWESMEQVIKYLERTNSPELATAKKAFSCFEPFSRDGQTYGVSAAFLGESCEQEVIRLLLELQKKRQASLTEDEMALSAELNALVAHNAEHYYRSMVRGGNDSWNIRDRHMVEVLNRLLAFHGPDTKAIVWEHNTHVGDARATDMVQEGMINVGQLVREQMGEEQVFIVGFGTHHGTVIAAKEWGAPLENMIVPPAQPESWEDLFHQAGPVDKMLMFRDLAVRPLFEQERGHRAIGVVYHPQYERFGNYVPTQLANRYDAFIYIDRTQALHPLILREVLV